MPTNEFDLSVRPEYVSNKLAIPFNELNAMASQHQKEYDNAEDSAYKFKDLMASVKAIHDPSLGLSNIGAKDALYSKYAPRIEAISNEIAKGTNIGEANRKLSQLQREWVNDPTRVELENSYNNYTKYVEDKTKKGSKYDPFLDDYAGQQLIGEDGSLKPFRFNGMDESLDVPKRFKEIMGNITQDVKSWDVESLGTDGIKIGNKGKRAGVDEIKVNKVVDNKVNLALNTDEGRQFVKKLKKINPNISEKEILNETRKQLFSSAYEQIGSEKMDGNSVDPTVIWSALHKEGKEQEDAVSSLISSTEESKTSNAIHSDEGFKSLFDNEVFKEKNGVVTFDPNGLLRKPDSKQGYTTGSMGSYMGSGAKFNNLKQEEKSQLLIDQIIKMSKAVGKNLDDLKTNGKLDNNKIGQLATAYNSLSKFRALDLNLTKAASDIEGDVATRNWNNITVLNPETGKPTDKEEYQVNEGDKVIPSTRRVIDGKTYIEGKINKKDGTSIPVLYRPNTIEKNKVFDGLAKLQQLSIDNLSKDNVSYQGDFNIPELNLGANMKIEGKEAIGQGRYVMSIVDPNNKMNNKYVLLNDNDEVLDIKSSLGDMKKIVEKHWYTNTPEGNTELTALLKNKSLYDANAGK
jgi:hypothetical protein